ncbi:hypothetical protein OEA41_002385 [Lepraria neglecta]|uniref:Uncharacterized protein n=1 Tax=Lepraria neglecta TaxID=209136 RepID=A0AAE0DM79_9LECA|nr:hypothetical protein OEA41_002385 [Lepraria neglecta]
MAGAVPLRILALTGLLRHKLYPAASTLVRKSTQFAILSDKRVLSVIPHPIYGGHASESSIAITTLGPTAPDI